MRVVYGKCKGNSNWDVVIDGKAVNILHKHSNLEEVVTIIEKRIISGSPLRQISDTIGVRNVVNIIKNVFPEIFLASIEKAKNLSIAQDGIFYLNSYLKDYFGIKSIHRVIKIFTQPTNVSLHDRLLRMVLDGNDMAMNLSLRLKNNQLLQDLCESVGMASLMLYILKYQRDEFGKYIDRLVKEYTINRKIVYYSGLIQKVFGKRQTDTPSIAPILELIQMIADKEYKHQCEYFVLTNNQTMKMSSDYWALCYMRGTALNQVNYDFARIKSHFMKQEIKVFYKNKLAFAKKFENCKMNNLINAVNFLTENNGIHHFADIDNLDVNSLSNFLRNDVTSQFESNLHPSTVRGILNELSEITEFLMEEGIAKYSKPKHNFFRDITFYNLSKMSKTTDVIPDEVIEQICLHISELKPMFQRMLNIFDGTGMRSSEVTHLKMGCISDTSNELHFVSSKVIKARRRRSLPDSRMIFINDKVKDCIREQINDSEELRKLSGSSYLFLQKSANNIFLSRGGFNLAINNLIKKYDIRDLQGKLWRFGSRQMRKTVTANMIMNGASETEVMHQLGHFHAKTARRHYEDVEKMKLAELNTTFFKEQFEIKIGKERLELFSEEERKALYVDFRSNYREVEFGHCTKHISEGVCNKRSGKIQCANCPKICTGKKYIAKWTSLLQSQQDRVKELKRIYAIEGIEHSTYCGFIEYKVEIHRLNSYQDIVNSILEE